MMCLVNSLVIGYGNSLRSDDGIGIKVAQIVEGWDLIGVRSLSLHQLTPELTIELAKVDLAIFVDAYRQEPVERKQGLLSLRDRDGVKLYPLKPSTPIAFASHFSEPKALLNLTRDLFGKCPKTWWVIVPGVDFQLGDNFSPLAQQGIEQALNIVKRLLTTTIK